MTFLLPFAPTQAGYAETPRAAATMYRVEGGRPRGRLDLDAPAPQVAVAWTLRAARYRQLMSFYRAATEGRGGSLPFEMDLILDEPGLTRYTVRFVPGSMQLVGVSGGTYSASALLEVDALAPDVHAEFDDILLDLYEAFGSGADALEALGGLAQLVNETLPTELAL